MRSRVIVAAAILVILAIAATTAYVVLFSKPANATATATATVFIGSAQVERNGSTTFATLHSGDQLGGGDTVRTGASSKAAINFPDGSITRLDGSTELKVKAITRDTSGNYQTLIDQTAGKTWSKVQQLVGGARFQVSAPNGSTAEVRGTEFAVIIETAPDGTVIVRIDTYSGSLNVSANGFPAIHVDQGQSTTIGSRAPPSPVVPIPAADRNDSFTVFNQTLDVTPGAPIGFDTDVLNEGDTSPVATAPAANGRDDLNFTLGWPGSTFEIIVVSSNGTELARQSSTTPPVTVTVLHAPSGAGYKVHDIQSKPKETYWVIVTHKTDKSPPRLPLASITLSPATASINAGTSQAFAAQGFDSTGNSLGNVTASTAFSITPDGRCTGATCTATIPGAHTITGTDSGKTATATVTVNPGPLSSITLSPATTTVAAGGSQTYAAEGFDVYSNSLGDVTGATTFSITPDGSCTGASCTATFAGAHIVTGNDGGVTATASLTVNAGPLASIALVPGSASIPFGSSQAFAARGFDVYGNGLGNVTASTNFSIAPNGSCAGASCTATLAGAHTVTGNDSGKTATATLTVNAVVASITLSPTSASIVAGGSQTYTAQGFDLYGASLGNVTASTTFSATGGTCTGATCTATLAGTQTVTGNDGGVTATATLTVSVGPLASITLSPATGTIAAGGSQAYTATGFDAYGNSLGSVTGATTFGVAPNGSCTAASCTAIVAGAHTVTGNDAGKTATATLTVSAGPLASVTISPATASIIAGGSQAYAATGFDLYSNSLGDVTGATTFSIAPDGSCTGASCTATIPGAHTVTANDSGKTAAATLTVSVGPLASLTISPASAIITAGGSQAYTAQGFDINGNSLGNVTGATTFSVTGGTCAGATCTATLAGAQTVTGNDGGATATASLTVNAGPLASITISPASATIAAGGSQAYVATGFDAYGNSLGNVTGATTFGVAPDGSCTAASCTAIVAGAHTVTGNDSGKTATATLTVSAGPLASVTISPATASIIAGSSQAYTTQGFDINGNSLGNVTGATTFTVTGGGCLGATCTATVAGAQTVTANDSGKTATATLTVSAGPLASITISPASASITAGGSQAYTATGFDANGNSLGNVTGATTFSVTGGTCTGATCTATVAGAQTVTGNDSGKTATASLTANAGPLASITISPATASIAAGGSQAYTANGFDLYSNSLGNVTGGTTFSIAPDGSCTGATCTASANGAHTVTGNDSGKTATVSLTVSTAIANILLSASPSTILADGSSKSNILAKAVDVNGAPVPASLTITVTLTSSNPACCVVTTATTTIGAGLTDSSAAQGVVTSTTSAGSSTISGTASDGTNTYPVTAAIVTTTLNSIGLPAQVLTPPGGTNTFSFTVSPAAPSLGLTVNFTTLNTSLATVTPSVALAAGATGGSATLTGVANGQTTITASATGYATTSTVATVKVIAISFNPSSYSLPATTTATGVVNLSAAAPSGGLVVNLSFTTGGFATVSPASVVVPAGQLTSSQFTITGTALGTDFIKGNASGATGGQAQVSVAQAPTLSLPYNGSYIGAGLYRDNAFYVSLSYPAPSGGVVVNLTNTSPAVASVPATITIPAGQSTGYYRLTGITNGSTTITASASGWISSNTITINVETPALSVYYVNTSQTTLTSPTTFYVYVGSPNSGVGVGSLVSASTVTLTVTTLTGTPGGSVTPTPMTFPIGASYVIPTQNTPTGSGTYTITASMSGFTSGTSSTVTVTQPSLSLAYNNTYIGAGLYRDDFYVSLSNPAPTGGLVVNLVSAAPTVASVPASITIPAGQTTGYYRLTGVSNGSTTITASASGWSGSTITINVETPALSVYYVNTSQTTLTSPTTFYVYVGSPTSGVGVGNLVSASTLTFTVNTLTGTPGGSVTPTSMTFPIGASYVSTPTQNTPTGSGTYTITASMSGFNSGTSSTVTTTSPYLTLQYNNSNVGAGIVRTGAYYVSLSNPAPAGGLTVNLASSDTTKLTVPASITILAGQTSGYYDVTGVTVGTPTITATASGWTSSTITVNVVAPTFTFSGITTSRTTSSTPDTVTVTMYVPNCGVCGVLVNSETVNVSVSGSPSTIVTVSPASVTIAAGAATSGSFSVSTPTATGTYNIIAAGSGFTSGTSSSVIVT